MISLDFLRNNPDVVKENIKKKFQFHKVELVDKAIELDKQIRAYKQEGDSMIDASILDGDYVVVKQSQDAENGQIVVALVGDGATVKTFYKEKDCIRLQPENPLYHPIISPDIQVLGVVVGLVRKF